MLARVVSGTCVGIALAGGGAPCAAHVGLVQALLDEGIPIDYVCGSAGGALIRAAAAALLHINTAARPKE
jgi:NTE family protein